MYQNVYYSDPQLHPYRELKTPTAYSCLIFTLVTYQVVHLIVGDALDLHQNDQLPLECIGQDALLKTASVLLMVHECETASTKKIDNKMSAYSVYCPKND